MNITKLNATQKMRVQVMIPDMLKLISAMSNRSDAPADLKATAKGIVQGIKGDEMPWTEIAVEIVNEDVGFATALGGNGPTASDGDEEAYDPSGDGDEAAVAEQSLASTDEMANQRETPGVSFLAVQGDDILAEPGSVDNAAASEENGEDYSKQWEIPSADDSRLEEQTSGEEIPEVDVYVSDDDCPTDEAGSPRRLQEVDP